MGRDHELSLDRMFQREVRAGKVDTIVTTDIALTQNDVTAAGNHHLTIHADIVTLSEDLHFPGKHLTINARIIRLEKSCTIDTSTRDPSKADWWNPERPVKVRLDDKQKPIKDNDGNLVHEDGWLDHQVGVRPPTSRQTSASQKNGARALDGSPGGPGIDAGDIVLVAERFELAQPSLKLTLIANGSKGGRGGDGGNGEPGGPGYPATAHFNARPSFKDLSAAQRAGIRGGDGGGGGNGGRPGEGGKGGHILVAHILQALPREALVVEAKGGPPGDPGGAGHGAPGGTPTKLDGTYYYIAINQGVMMSVDIEGEVGSRGPDGVAGAPANAGHAGDIEDRVKLVHADLIFGRTTRIVPINQYDPLYDAHTGNLAIPGRYRGAEFSARTSLSLTKERALAEIPTVIAFDDRTASSLDQRLLTFNKIKIAFLNGDIQTVEELLTWLVRVTPGERDLDALVAACAQVAGRFSDKVRGKMTVSRLTFQMEDDSRRYELPMGLLTALRQVAAGNDAQLTRVRAVRTERETELRVWRALRARVVILVQYATAGLDFYGHAADYVPLPAPSAFEKRIAALLSVARHVEQEHRAWQRAAHAADVAVEQAKVVVASLGTQIQVLKTDVDADIDWLRSAATSDKLQALDRNVELAVAGVYQNYQGAVHQLNAKLTGALGLGVLKFLAQVVLVSTGNFGAAQCLGYAEKALKAAGSVVKGTSADPKVAAELETISKAFGDVKTGVKDMKDVLGGRGHGETLTGKVTGPGDLALDVTLSKPPDAPKPVLEKTVECILPMVEQIGDIMQLGAKLAKARVDFGNDRVMVAMQQGTYDALIEKLIAEAGSDAEGLKSAFDEYTAKVQERNKLFLEHRARWLKVSEIHAQAALMHAQLARWGSEVAASKDARMIGMTSFWAQVYDSLRDRILDLIYEAYRAYVYRTLDERPFARFSPTDLGSDTQSEAHRRISEQIAKVGINQNVTTLELLNDALQRAHRALEEQVVIAKVEVKNEGGRIIFERADHERQFQELQATGEALFEVSPDAKAFADLAHLHFTEIKAFIPGARAEDWIRMELVHCRVVAVKDLAGRVHHFNHGPVEVLRYEYRIVPVKDGPKPEPGVFRYRDVERGEDYIEVVSNALTNQGQIEVNPCTWWRVRVPKARNAGLDLSGATRLVLQFTGEGRHINDRGS